MEQFYLLSVLLNLVGGLTLAGDYLGEKTRFLCSFKNMKESSLALKIVGAAAALTGFIKLFVLSPGETVPVAGDLLPACTGILIGGILLFEAFRGGLKEKGDKMEKLSRTIVGYRVPLGLTAALVGILHFLVPGAPVL